PSDRLGEGTQELSEATTITRRISLAPDIDLLPLLGRNDDHLRTLEHELDIRIVARGHDIMLKGDERQVRKAERALVQLAELARIVLTRPAVEAGERLGFLPGDLYEKVHPYLRPLYDALYDMLEAEKVQSLIEKGAIEIAPLAYMRGRTLNDAFIILDEAQNSTTEQMKMFLTRLGFNSKMVITGDITQVDLPASRASGL